MSHMMESVGVLVGLMALLILATVGIMLTVRFVAARNDRVE